MNPGFDQPSIHRVLTNADARARARLHSLAALCRDEHLDGIQFDIENVHVRDKDALTSFTRESVDSVHHAGCTLSAAVVPRTGEDPGPNVLPQVDLRQLARGLRLQGARRHARLHLVHDVRAAHRRIACRARGRTSVDRAVAAVRALARRSAGKNLARHSRLFRLVVSRLRFDQRLAHARRATSRIQRRRRFSRRAASSRRGTTYRRRRSASWSEHDVFQYLWIEDARALHRRSSDS